jgi:hypothetical protein
MTLAEFALIFAIIALVVLWRLESKLNQIVRQLGFITETLGLMEQKTEEIGDSISSVAVNIATRK